MVSSSQVILTGTGQTTADLVQYNTRMSVKNSNNWTYFVHKDVNASGAVYGNGSNVANIKIYKASPNASIGDAFFTPTLVATIAAPANYARITVAIDPNDVIQIVIVSADFHTMSHRTFDTSTDTAGGSWTTVLSVAATINIDSIDCQINTQNIPVIAYQTWTNSTLTNVCKVAHRATTGGAWVHTTIRTDVYPAAKKTSCESTSILGLLGGGGGADGHIAAFGLGHANADLGIFVYTYLVATTTGAVSSITNRVSNLCVGESLNSSTRVVGRNIKLYRRSLNTWYFGVSHSEVNRRIGVMYGSWNGITWSASAFKPNSLPYAVATGVTASIAMSYGDDVINFMYLSTQYNSKINPLSVTVAMDYDNGVELWSPANLLNFPFEPVTTSNYVSLFGNDGGYFTVNVYPEVGWASHTWTALLSDGATSYYLVAQLPTLGTGAYPVDPGEGSVVNTSTPVMTSRGYYSATQFPFGSMRMAYTFATDEPMTNVIARFVAPHNVQPTSYGPSWTTYIDQILAANRIPQGNYYFQVQPQSVFGHRGGSAASPAFIQIVHPPSAAPVSPTTSYPAISWNAGKVTVRWNFADTSESDVQTKFQVRLHDQAGAVAQDSGVITSGVQLWTSGTLSGTYKDQVMYWEVKVWDTDNVVGSYSPASYFKMSDLPSAAITVPATNAVLTSGIPTITFTPTVSGTRTVTGYEVRVTQGATIIWNKVVTGLNAASGTPISVTADGPYLKNTQTYSYSVSITDSFGMTATSPIKQVTTAWTAPAAPTGVAVVTTAYNVEDQGYNTITWSDTGRDADFNSWIILRRDDHIHPLTGAVIDTGVYNQIASVSSINTAGYTFLDYTAPSGYKVNYLVQQVVNRFGDTVPSSNSTPTTVFPKSDGYWLIETDPLTASTTAYRLTTVTADTFTEEYERAEYTVIGRGRHVDRGTSLGSKGSLEAQLRDSATQSARQKRLRLKQVLSENIELYVRNPFGDLIRVSVGDVSISRIAGVGSSEFVDITLPYSEVSE